MFYSAKSFFFSKYITSPLVSEEPIKTLINQEQICGGSESERMNALHFDSFKLFILSREVPQINPMDIHVAHLFSWFYLI